MNNFVEKMECKYKNMLHYVKTGEIIDQELRSRNGVVETSRLKNGKVDPIAVYLEDVLYSILL